MKRLHVASLCLTLIIVGLVLILAGPVLIVLGHNVLESGVITVAGCGLQLTVLAVLQPVYGR